MLVLLLLQLCQGLPEHTAQGNMEEKGHSEKAPVVAETERKETGVSARTYLPPARPFLLTALPVPRSIVGLDTWPFEGPSDPSTWKEPAHT